MVVACQHLYEEVQVTAALLKLGRRIKAWLFSVIAAGVWRTARTRPAAEMQL